MRKLLLLFLAVAVTGWSFAFKSYDATQPNEPSPHLEENQLIYDRLAKVSLAPWTKISNSVYMKRIQAKICHSTIQMVDKLLLGDQD